MTSPIADTAWRSRLLESDADIARLLREVKTIAVLGIKPAHTGQPAYYVPAYAQRAGYEVIPVPVYYPEATEILDRPVYRKLADIPGPVDMVNVFRRPNDVPPHVDDILAKRPKAVWMQSGISHPQVAERLAREGIEVVQDRCLMVELRQVGK
jgi:predicted CoA-binding protein